MSELNSVAVAEAPVELTEATPKPKKSKSKATKTKVKAKAPKAKTEKSTEKIVHGVLCPRGKFWNDNRIAIV